jgi:hypothetical protein
MQTKLTLRLDDDLIEHAKVYAKDTGRSLSKIVSDYFLLLSTSSTDQLPRISKNVSNLRGVLKGSDFDESDYKRHLEDKHL